jgi:Fic family protein
MRIVDVDDDDALGVSMLEEIRRTAERRLQQIEPLIEEAEQLRGVLDAIAKRPTRRERTSQSGRSAERATVKRTGNEAPRAKKGANKRVILELVERRPGITPAEIAKLTGMKRTVAASTVSRLKRYGYLREHEQGGVCLGRAADAEPERSMAAAAS